MVPFLALLATSACSTRPEPQSQPEPELRNVGIAPPESPLQQGDCDEARRRLAARPDMTVDRLPEPVAMRPAPFQRVPPRAWNRDGSAVVKVEVMIDTLGRADMTTFTPVQVSNPWFTANIKSLLPRWRFEPAMLAGCKVHRVYRFTAVVPPRSKRR